MSDLNVIRAWKDEMYRNGLSTDEQAQLPANPAGAIELTEDELQGVDGATPILSLATPVVESITYATLGAVASGITGIIASWIGGMSSGGR